MIQIAPPGVPVLIYGTFAALARATQLLRDAGIPIETAPKTTQVRRVYRELEGATVITTGLTKKGTYRGSSALMAWAWVAWRVELDDEGGLTFERTKDNDGIRPRRVVVPPDR